MLRRKCIPQTPDREGGNIRYVSTTYSNVWSYTHLGRLNPPPYPLDRKTSEPQRWFECGSKGQISDLP
jgi:hypothetical protein